jgi:hypothetical protein
MAFSADKIRQGAAGQGGYELDQSLRFNDDDSAYLSWTPTSAGNRTTWTWSGWIKLGSAGDGWHMIFSAGSSSNGGSTGENLTGLLLYNDTLYIYWDSAAGGTNPAMKLRDPSAWYHVCLVATSSSLACYINGTLVGTKSGSGNGAINNTLRHGIGVRGDALTSNFDGYMAEVNFIDGTAVAATSFGETGDYGEWKPIEYSGTYGTNGFYLSFAGGGVMSATGGDSIGTDGDYKYNTFLSDATFTPSADGYVEYLVIAGGGSGGSGYAVGGGGAGGYKTGYLAVTGSTAYSITVGDGGAVGSSGASGGDGDNSVFSTITSTGGGGGGGSTGGDIDGNNGGSGGGCGRNGSTAGTGTSGQGNNGGTGCEQSSDDSDAGGGGGGATAAGSNGTCSTSGAGGNGGNGTASSITGSSVTRAGGGGGGARHGSMTQSSGGSGGGGAGSLAGGSSTIGTANTGGGGGGGGNNTAGGAGGSGVVIIRYKFQ